MNKIRKAFVLTLVFMLTICIATPTTYAASGKKTVYVLTKVKVTEDDGFDEQVLKYNKNGLLSKVNGRDDVSYSYKSTFKYNGKKQATSQTTSYYKNKKKYKSGKVKFNYTKKGYLSKAREYAKYGKAKKFYLSCANYYNWDSQGLLIKDRLKDVEDGGETIETYNYDSGGNYTGSQGYNSNDEDETKDFSITCTYLPGDMRVLRKYENSSPGEKMELRSITKQTLQNGRLVRSDKYEAYEDEGGEHEKELDDVTVYTYKKIKVPKKYYKKVVKQQKYILKLIRE